MSDQIPDMQLLLQFIDADFYSDQLKTKMSNTEAATHYLKEGWQMGLNPSPSFLTDYYLSRNQDVRNAGMNPLLHYINWGQYEGRSPNPSDRNRIYTPNELCVVDYFDHDYYIAQYFRGAEIDIDPLKHYMHFGWRQGYNPSRSFQTNEYISAHEDCSFDVVNPLLHKVISDRNRDLILEASAAGTLFNNSNINSIKSTAAELRKSHKIKFAWERHLVAHEFVALNQKYAPYISDYYDILAAFLCCGIEDLAPLSFDSFFDYDFYTRSYKDVRDLPPIEAYRHWLHIGVECGRYCSEPSFLQAVTGRKIFPEAFNWIEYKKSLPEGNGELWPRWKCLEHLLDFGYKEHGIIPINQGDVSKLYEIVSDRFWSVGDKDLAINTIKKSIVHAERPGHLLHKLGDYYRETTKPFDAVVSYTSALDNGYADVWTYLNLANIYSEMGNYSKAYDCLRRSKDKYGGVNVWRKGVDNLIRADFDAGSKESRKLFALNNDIEAERLMRSTLDRISSAIEELEGLPAKIGVWPEGPVIFFALTSVPQCKHYRVDQRIQQFEEAGIAYKLFDGSQPIEAKESLIGARALFIYREPAFPGNVRLILHARALGIPVYYDIDDLIFDLSHYPEPYETYRDQIDYDSYVGLKYASPLYRYAIEMSDYGISSTETLSKFIEPLTKEQRCFLLPNGIDNRNLTFLDSGTICSKGTNVKIFYGSGAKAHNRNFNQCVAPALAKIMEIHPSVELFIAGYLSLSPVLSPFSDRIHTVDFTRDIISYWALLKQMDINIATLTSGVMNDCKSEIKWIEASCCGVASVMSASATYQSVITDGRDGLLVYEPVEWFDKLNCLIDNPKRRYEIANNARDKVRQKYSLEILSRDVSKMLRVASETRQVIRIDQKKLRLLIVNVLFSPQSYGGATRVVESQVRDLQDRYGSEVDVAVFTTDYMGDPGRVRVDEYSNVPVFRFGPFLHDPFLYDEDGPGVYFSNVVDSWCPDVVHFHSVQYLTASLMRCLLSKKIPYVVTIHDGWWFSQNQFFIDTDGFLRLPGAALDIKATSLESLRRQHVLNFLLKGASALTTVSSSFAEICSAAGFEDVVVIENGASLHPEYKPPLLKKYDDKVVIGFVGGRAVHKGYHLLRAALTRGDFPNLSLVFVDHEQHSDFREQTTWGTTEVRIVGLIQQANMSGLYESLDVLCAPSVWPESYGLVSREASSFGLWVIANKIGGMGEDIIHGQNGFVIDTTSLDGLNRCLLEINDNPLRFKKRLKPSLRIEASRLQTDKLVGLFKEVLAYSSSK